VPATFQVGITHADEIETASRRLADTIAS